MAAIVSIARVNARNGKTRKSTKACLQKTIKNCRYKVSHLRHKNNGVAKVGHPVTADPSLCSG
jgi:hypothetical protein